MIEDIHDHDGARRTAPTFEGQGMSEVTAKDTLCLDSLSPGRYATGVRVCAQRCYHRLITPRGMLRGGDAEQNFGLDLASMCGASVTPELRAAIGPRIENEIRKDVQIDTVSASVEDSTVAGATTWTITVEAETKEGPFELVLAVSGVTVQLLGLEAA